MQYPRRVGEYHFARASAVLAGEVELPVVRAGARVAHRALSLGQADLVFAPEALEFHTHSWRTPTWIVTEVAPFVVAALMQLCGATRVEMPALLVCGHIPAPFTRWPTRAAMVWFAASYRGFTVEICPPYRMGECIHGRVPLPTWIPPEHHLAELRTPLACEHCGVEALMFRTGVDAFVCGECRRPFRPPLDVLATARFLQRY